MSIYKVFKCPAFGSFLEMRSESKKSCVAWAHNFGDTFHDDDDFISLVDNFICEADFRHAYLSLDNREIDFFRENDLLLRANAHIFISPKFRFKEVGDDKYNDYLVEVDRIIKSVNSLNDRPAILAVSDYYNLTFLYQMPATTLITSDGAYLSEVTEMLGAIMYSIGYKPMETSEMSAQLQ